MSPAKLSVQKSEPSAFALRMIGSDSFIPGFEEQLIGMTAGGTRTVKVTFPQSYPAENLAGKDAEFDVTVKSVNGEIRIEVRDYGIGITPENQRFIFGGFFHIQDTNLYASKRPYQFNAGGTGSDLLRIKAFSERFGFKVGFESKRCRFLPTDDQMCPGKISECGVIKNKSECFSAGGSTFSLTFPSALIGNPPPVTH